MLLHLWCTEGHWSHICCISSFSLSHMHTAHSLYLGANRRCLLMVMEGIMMWVWTALPFLMMQTNYSVTHFQKSHCCSNLLELWSLKDVYPNEHFLLSLNVISSCASVSWRVESPLWVVRFMYFSYKVVPKIVCVFISKQPCKLFFSFWVCSIHSLTLLTSQRTWMTHSCMNSPVRSSLSYF